MLSKRCYRLYSTLRNSIKSPFEILQLPRHATQTEIKQKYYELAKEVHPDRGLEKGDSAAFQELSDAYEFLKQPEQRTLYLKTGWGWDTSLRQSSASPPPPPPSRPAATYDNVTYRGGPWSSHQNTRYASNKTIFAILTGIMLTLAVTNLIYTPFASSWMKALDAHHAKTIKDLETARTNARKYGNQRGVQRIVQASYHNKSDNDKD